MEVELENVQVLAQGVRVKAHEANADETPAAHGHEASACVIEMVGGEEAIEMPVQTPVIVQLPQLKEGPPHSRRPHVDTCGMPSTVDDRAQSFVVNPSDRRPSSPEAARNLSRSSMSTEQVLEDW
jgi:hypothetical protein